MKIVKIGDQMSIEKLMVNESVSQPVRFWNVKLASQLKINSELFGTNEKVFVKETI